MKVVIIGGGFGGLHTARHLKRVRADVTLIDRRNYHLFQPLLYQVATGGLSPGDITAPIRHVLRRHANTRVVLDEVIDIDTSGKRIILREQQIAYDILVVATGASHHYFGHNTWAGFAPGLKSIGDATEIRKRILYAFEAAERTTDPTERQAWLTFVVVGAGPTGVELAGALGELAHDTLRRDFRVINPADAQILLVEGADRVLTSYPQKLSARAERSLQRLGVTTLVSTFVTDVSDGHVTLQSGDRTQNLQTHCILWAAGVKASPVGGVLADACGAELDRVGRVVVNEQLNVPGHPEIFVIGDLALVKTKQGTPLPGVAPVAMQQGRFVARVIRRRAQGNHDDFAFRYRHKGDLATIGRKAAVADFGRIHVWGAPAWLLWLSIHLAFLIDFENRILVLVQWAWSYITRNRGARLIVGDTGTWAAQSGEPEDTTR